MAPEIIDKNYGKEVDIWIAGILMYLIIKGRPPFIGNDILSIRKSI